MLPSGKSSTSVLVHDKKSADALSLPVVRCCRWKVLPQDERDGIKNYVVGKIMEIAKDEATMEHNKLFLNKLNMVLVQILKQVGARALLFVHDRQSIQRGEGGRAGGQAGCLSLLLNHHMHATVFMMVPHLNTV
jgi:hypothetical protein